MGRIMEDMDIIVGFDPVIGPTGKPHIDDREEAWRLKIPEAARVCDSAIVGTVHVKDAGISDNFRRIWDTVKAEGLSAILQMWLWPAWDAGSQRHLVDVFDPAYYASVLERLYALGEVLEADALSLYTEPHGKCPYANWPDKDHAWFKRTQFNSAEDRRVVSAVQSVLHKPLDYVYGRMKNNRFDYGHTFRRAFGAGKPITTATYSARLPEEVPWSGDDSLLTLWSSYVPKAMSVQEAINLPWPAIRRRFPIEELYLYSDVDDKVRMLDQLEEFGLAL